MIYQHLRQNFSWRISWGGLLIRPPYLADTRFFFYIWVARDIIPRHGSPNSKIGEGIVKVTFLMQPTVEDAQQYLPPDSVLETQSGKSEPAFGPLTSDRQDENVTMMGEFLPGLHLFIEKAVAASGTLAIDTFPAILGRSHPLLTGEKEVSRQHVEFQYDPGLKQIQVIDLNSANGSFLNGARLMPQVPCVINSGMRLQLGPNVILVVR